MLWYRRPTYIMLKSHLSPTAGNITDEMHINDPQPVDYPPATVLLREVGVWSTTSCDVNCG